jgi:hypothetical protein
LSDIVVSSFDIVIPPAPSAPSTGFFFRRGTSVLWWVTSIANTSAPAATEINAGTDISRFVGGIDGLTINDTPTGGYVDWDQTTSVPLAGTSEVTPATLHLYEQKGTSSNTLRTTLAPGAAGNLVMFPVGLAGSVPTVGDLCEVWPMVSAGPRREYSIGNDPARWRCLLIPTAVPVLDAVLV